MSNILYRRYDRYADYADKVKVRDYVESKGLGHILPKLYGVWERAADVDFDSLPDKFVIKANHGCGYNIICTDKSTFDTEAARAKLDGWMNTRYNSRIETHYSLIEPRIFAEEFIDDGSGLPPADYKFACVKGEPFLVMLCKDRDAETGIRFYVFDREWNCVPEYWVEKYDDWDTIPKPDNLAEMVEYAALLSADFNYVRVDLYNTGKKIYFGELTFTPVCGKEDSYTDKAIREMYAKLKGE